MSWKMWSAFPLVEITLVIICFACAAINVRTLSEAIQTYRRVVRSGQNHGAQIWSWVSVRNKGCYLAVQVVFLAWGLDRYQLLANGLHLYQPERWMIYGVARTVCSVLVAFTAWTNMRAFEQLRDGE
jgi:hypothetical protein